MKFVLGKRAKKMLQDHYFSYLNSLNMTSIYRYTRAPPFGLSERVGFQKQITHHLTRKTKRQKPVGSISSYIAGSNKSLPYAISFVVLMISKNFTFIFHSSKENKGRAIALGSGALAQQLERQPRNKLSVITDVLLLL